MPTSDSSSTPVPLIVDDDGSQDGMTALAYMLQNPKFSVKAITVSQGLGRPQIFGNNVELMLTRLGKTGIPVGVGRETPLAGNNAFPPEFRDPTDTFWSPFVSLPDRALETVDRRDAAQLIIDTVKNSPEPVQILATGSQTNIAEALRRDPTIIDNIAGVHIMGGAVFVPGNLREHLDPILKQNAVSEFNIWVDPQAAKEVFDAASKGLPVFLTPLDATNQIGFSRADLNAWKATGTPESAIASELLDFALTVVSGNDPLIPNPAWDLVAALTLSEPTFSKATPLYLDVNTNGAPSVNQGQTFAVPNLPPNVNVYLNPSFNNLGFSSGDVFKSSNASVGNIIVGTASNEYLDGGAGNDTISGNGGNDNLDGEAGDDIISGGPQADRIFGATGNDTIYGNGGKDLLIGGLGNDLIYGGPSADTILGGGGNDTIYGNGGKDSIDGGLGSDAIWLGSGKATVALTAGDGFDTINGFLVGATKLSVSNSNNLSFTDSSNGVQIFQGNDLLAVVSGQLANTFSNNIATIFVA